MSNETNNSTGNKLLFWGCFIALITTAFAFITRAFLVNTPDLWPAAFGLDAVKGQELFGAGIWPFAISIIAFSLIIDKVGYKTAMIFSFVCYALYAGMAFMAHGIVSGAEGEALHLVLSFPLGLDRYTAVRTAAVQPYLYSAVQYMYNIIVQGLFFVLQGPL